MDGEEGSLQGPAASHEDGRCDSALPHSRAADWLGSVTQLAENISLRSLKRILVVTDKVLMELKLPHDLLSALEEREIAFTVFDRVQPNPTIENIEEGVRTYKDHRCQAIVAFGGGAPIDCAKIIGARISNGCRCPRLTKSKHQVTQQFSRRLGAAWRGPHVASPRVGRGPGLFARRRLSLGGALALPGPLAWTNSMNASQSPLISMQRS